MENNKVKLYLALSQLSLLSFLTLCIVLLPGFLFSRNEGGVSNYGIHEPTVVPYTLGSSLCAIFIAQAAHYIAHGTKAHGSFRYSLYILAGLLLFSLVSTYRYKVNSTYKNIHIIAGILLFCFEMAMATWMALIIARDRTSIMLLAVQAGGFIVYPGRMPLPVQ